jgi:predicted nucleotidyltransferase
MVDEEIVASVNEELDSIEREHKVRVLFACESGSRAWGFPSSDSDYDVRFLYVHDRDWYLRVDNAKLRDVIEKPIDDDLDVSGWELRKALTLLRKSNPALIEWINSPIVYRKDAVFFRELRALIPTYFSARACYYHYSHMASGNNRSYLQGDMVRIKKYFYVLRPLLAMKWIEKDLGVVPMEFEALLNAVIDYAPLRDEISDLIKRKKIGFESEDMPRIEIISDFIDSELERFSKLIDDFEASSSTYEPVNRLFLDTLDRGTIAG